METPYTTILLATPAYGGNVCARYTESLVQTCELFRAMNIKYTLKFINNQLVTRARNMLCHIFMKDERFTHMMFLDADNYFDCNVVDHDYLTEDYYFSYLFLKNGGKIYADTSITLLHIGNHEYGTLLK